MKIKLLLFISIFLCNNLMAQSKATAIKLNGFYTLKDNFCTATIFFKPNGEFYYEAGCEARSNIAKGKYTINGKKIVLKTIAEPIQYIINKANNYTNRKINFSVQDANGKPLAYTKILTLPSKLNLDTLKDISYQLTDSVGKLIMYTSQIAALSFDFFKTSDDKINNKNIQWKNLLNFNADKITVQFNYPAFCLRYPDIVETSFVLELQPTQREGELIDNKNNIYTKSEK